MRFSILAATFSVFLLMCLGQNQLFAGQERSGMTAEISTGDNQWMLWLPMDSKVAVESAFDVLAEDFHVDRIWWRGGQDEYWWEHYEFRPANRFYYELWSWVRHLIEDVGTNRAAVAAAHKRGMQIWMETGLFEFAAHADGGGCIAYPYQCEAKIRLEHPEWIPVNRYGTRTQNGPVEFAYPEARREVVNQLTKFLVANHYDGIVFYTYVENFSYRYLDEFGYNEPIVREFKRRYGVDILTQPFDKEAWARLRGEYVTQFLRELKAALKPHGIQIAIRLNPLDGQSQRPEIWRSSGREPISTAGNLYMDWRMWAKEGVVDELCIYWPGNDETLKQVLDGVRGSDTRVSMYRTRGDLPAGVIRCLFPGEELTSGFARENFIGWEDEKISPQPLQALKGNDVKARRRVLYLIAHDKQPDAADTFDLVAKAAQCDSDLYARRLAVDALAALKDPRGVPILELALNDPENSVRCKAAVALGRMNAVRSIDRIFDAVGRTSTLQFTYMAARDAISRLASGDPPAVIRRTTDPDVNIRRLAVQCLGNTGGLETKLALLHAAKMDQDMYVRELSLAALAGYPSDPAIILAMEKAMNDGDETLQVRAATYLAWAMPRDQKATTEPSEFKADQPVRLKLFPADSDQGKVQRRGLDRLVKFFKQYGDHGRRADADWGWRAVGNAILCFGDEGEAELRKLIADPSDRRLAENAWQVVYIRQSVMDYCLVDEKQDEEAHRHHPFLKWDKR